MEHDFNPTDGRWINNWNSHRVKLVTLAAVALDDEAMWARTRTQFIAHLGRNLRENGSTLDFEERDALHYVVCDLEPLTRAVLAVRLRGENWLGLKGSTGASVADALDWLVPNARGDKTHEERGRFLLAVQEWMCGDRNLRRQTCIGIRFQQGRVDLLSTWPETESVSAEILYIIV